MNLAHLLTFVAQIASALFTLLTLAALVYSLLVFRAARAYSRACRIPLPAFHPSVTILKPVKGVDPEMYAAFASHCAQDYPSEYEILFGVHTMEDAAVEAIQRLQREFPQQAIRSVVCPQVLGANGKVSSLVQMAQQAKFDHLLINDSDIRVSPRYLRNVMPCFALPSKAETPVGMVTALYRGRSHGTLGSRLEALGISTDFMPGVLVSRWLEKGTHFGLGSTLAFTRDALDAIGGLLPLVDHLADDYELGAHFAGGFSRGDGARSSRNLHPDVSIFCISGASTALGAWGAGLAAMGVHGPADYLWTAVGAGEPGGLGRLARQRCAVEFDGVRAGGDGADGWRGYTG